MDSPTRIPSIPPLHHHLTTATTSSFSTSPDFEFWMVRNPSFPQPNLLSADELFHDGVLLPLHSLHQPDPKPPERTDPGSSIMSSKSTTQQQQQPTESLSTSKRWKDIIFKKHDTNKDKDKDKDKKKDKKSQSGLGNSSGTDLNINIWPFSRSRSDGGSVTRPRLFSGSNVTRKVSSAPCSRSNSAGESKSRKWPSSPGRAGVHLGRTSPVWQVRRGNSGSGSKTNNLYPDPVVKKEVSETTKTKPTKTVKIKAHHGGGRGGGDGNSRANKVLNLNVQTCIGYRHHLSCRSDDNSAIGVGSGSGGVTGGKSGGAGGGSSSIGNGSNVFNIRSLFTKNVY